LKKKRKRVGTSEFGNNDDSTKIPYKLMFTDERGKQREVSIAEFQEFKKRFPDIAHILENPD
jgi:hypothetical protein